jgi:hypothetical protein
MGNVHWFSFRHFRHTFLIAFTTRASKPFSCLTQAGRGLAFFYLHGSACSTQTWQFALNPGGWDKAVGCKGAPNCLAQLSYHCIILF